ncbi:hypothetical protein FS749_010297 [Ceratobasidium sp. UAMH 11750]|nr:hypothetical protein FS749_010297 [Ceratobasidium sp. UAMH 11750]
MQGFTEHKTTVSSGASVYCQYRRSASSEAASRPLLLLIHGYPQNHLMWKEFVKELPDDFDILIPDLPGYGNSTKSPSADDSNRAHSKRAWAQDIIEAARQIHDSFNQGQDLKLIAFGHDRGARLAYRMALDAPGTVVGLAVLDIVPTPFMWAKMSLAEGRHEETRKSHHWVFLASPAPLPETLISSQSEFYYTHTINSWAGTTARDAQKKAGVTLLDWQKDSIAPFLTNDKVAYDRIVSACEDYRAGSTVDVEDDLASGIDPTTFERNKQDASASGVETRIPVFSVPVLVLSSMHLRRRFPVDEIWRSLCAHDGLVSLQIGDDGVGHFFVNEATEETLQGTIPWLNRFK